VTKSQKRSNKEARKPKSVEKKPDGPKYLKESEGIQSMKLGEQKLGEHKARAKTAGK